ncbi:MAG: hypothetical protein ABEK16_05045 [Candidatus Nanohalobium sp.]
MVKHTFRDESGLVEDVVREGEEKSEAIRRALREYTDSSTFGMSDEDYNRLVDEMGNYNRALLEASKTGDLEPVFEAGEQVMDINEVIGDLLAKSYVSLEESILERQEDLIDISQRYIQDVAEGNMEEANRLMESMYEKDPEYAGKFDEAMSLLRQP